MHSQEEIVRTDPITPMQRSFLFELAQRGHDGTNFEQIVCRLERAADPDVLREAIRICHSRHDALRTRFVEEAGVAVAQAVLARFDPPFVRRSLPSGEAVAEFLAEDRLTPFEPFAAPPVRWTLLEPADGHPILVWSFLHALMDGRSFATVLRDLVTAEAAILEGRADALPVPAPSPSSLYHWHANRPRSGSLDFWREKLAGFGGKSAFPTQLSPTGDAGTDGHGRGHLRHRLDEGDSGRIREAAARLDVTPNNFVQGAWALVLGRYTLDDDVLFGAVRAARHGTVDEAKEAVGLAMNTVAVRADISGERRARDLLAELRAFAVSVRDHEHTPLLEVARVAGPDSAELPFDTCIIFDAESLDARMRRLEPGRPERYELHEQTSFPLTLYAYDDPELILELGFDRARVSDEAARTLLEQVATVLVGFADNPDAPLSDISLSSDQERARLESGLDGPSRPVSDGSALEDILARLRERPDAVSVRFQNRAYTRSGLDRASEKVARALVAAGCRRGDLVGVYRERSEHLPAIILGIWRAGAGYLPLDPTYPENRIAFKLEDARLRFVVTESSTTSRLPKSDARVLELDTLDGELSPEERSVAIDPELRGDDLAYMIYTSGSTGQPKGTLVEHKNVLNFFAGMDDCVRPASEDPAFPGVWLAVTSLSFDISVLEILYTLARGYEVVVHDERDDYRPEVTRVKGPVTRFPEQRIDLGLMFFSGAKDDDAAARYDFLLEAARRADEAGLSSVWTPERHFHEFGGPYPNPAVLGAAIARATRRLAIRAGSVVLPLHHPARVAEEWAVVDNLSRGRVGVSVASGWHARDFLLRPENHAERKRHTYEGVDVVRRLWRGEAVRFDGPDSSYEIRTLPRPVQAELPVWVTAAGNPSTFEEAGRLGANVLTHLLGQTFEEVGEKIRVYRAARAAAGHEGPGYVTLMLHAFVGEDRAEVKELVREPMKAYLRSAFGLVRDNAFDFPVVAKRVGEGADLDAAIKALSEEELDALHEHAFERYFERSGLFGTLEEALAIVDRSKEIGADEIACLVDFGVPFEDVLDSMSRLEALQRAANARGAHEDEDFSLPGLVRRYRVTHLQCTPSRARLLTLDPTTREALSSIQRLYVGGEALPQDLADELADLVNGEVWNMYGPTETTVWSAVHRVVGGEKVVPIGRPIANTSIRIVDDKGRLTPIGVAGELCIGGLGVTRGYFRRNALSAERFTVDPFADDPRARLYKTGDLARWKADGAIEFLGRRDHQVKIRGYRIEVGEIESVIREHPEVQGSVVVPWTDPATSVAQLVAYVVPRGGAAPSESDLRAHVRTKLPAYMMPSRFVAMQALPLLPNGKLDRKGLPSPTEVPRFDARLAQPANATGPEVKHAAATPATGDATAEAPRRAPARAPSRAASTAGRAAPTSHVEEQIAEIWKDVLGLEQVGRDQNFFDLGGHSLLVVQVHGRLKSAHPDLGITELFRFPTVAALAQHLVARALADAGGADSRADNRRSALAKRREMRRNRA